LPNLWYIDIMHVFQIVSATKIKENFAFFKELDELYGDKLLQVTYNPIVDPWYLSTSILDDDMKRKAYSDIAEIRETCTEKQSGWFKTAISELDKTQPDSRKRTWQNDFVRAEMALNKIRKTDTLKICPELSVWFDRYDENDLTPDKGTGANPGAHFDGKPKPAAKH